MGRSPGLGVTDQLAYTARTWRADGSNEDTATLLAAYNTWEQLHATSSTVFNVKDPAYGAKGDGVTDDTAAIQAAINAASAAGGGQVFLPLSTYSCGRLVFPSNVWFCGAGAGATKLVAKSGLNNQVLDSAVATSNICISDLTIDGNASAQTSGHAIGITLSNLLVIRNCRVINAKNSGIYFDTNNDCLIANNSIESCGSSGVNSDAGIRLSNSLRVRIIANRIETPGIHGILSGTNNCQGIEIIGNTIRNPAAGIGIATSGGTDNVVSGNYVTSAFTGGNCIDIGDSVNGLINDNVCVGGGSGIEQDSSTGANRGQRNTIVGNICHGNTTNGIGIIGGGGGATNGLDIVAANNIISLAGSSGLVFDGIIGGAITGNIVKNSTGAGIVVASSLRAASGITIQANRCYDDQGGKTQTYGIQSLTTSDFLTIIGNDVRGNLTGGMSLVGSNNKVRNNTGYVTENGGTSTQTPGAVATVNIAHGLAAAPTNYSVQPGDTNSRGAPSMYLTADATNVILNFSGNLTAATAYTWRWRAEV